MLCPHSPTLSPHFLEGQLIAATAKHRTHLTARRLAGIVLIVLCGWLAFTIFGQVVHGADLNSQVRKLASQTSVLRQQISDRQQEISQAQSPAWLEEQARMLGYVLPGEKVYVLATPGSTVPSGGGVNATLPSFSPSPSPSASPSPSSAPATPTPYNFTLTTPSPR